MGTKLRWLLAALALVALVVGARTLPVADWIRASTDAVASLGWLGPIAFGGAYVVAVLLLVPGSLITLAAGALFGVVVGTALVSIASTTAAALAFLLARSALRDRVQALAVRRPRFAAIDAAVGRGGWKVVALLRLSPVVPFNLSNYLFGLTPVSFWPYVLASWVAMFPATLAYVYLGYTGRAGALAVAGAETGRSPLEWSLLGVGLLATLAVTLYLTRLARRQRQPLQDEG